MGLGYRVLTAQRSQKISYSCDFIRAERRGGGTIAAAPAQGSMYDRAILQPAAFPNHAADDDVMRDRTSHTVT